MELTIGQRIRQYRARQGLTQEQLQEMAGLTSSYISKLERGERSPSLNTLRTLAQKLRCRVVDLSGVDDADSEKKDISETEWRLISLLRTLSEIANKNVTDFVGEEAARDLRRAAAEGAPSESHTPAEPEDNG